MDILHPLNEIVEYKEVNEVLKIKVPADADKKKLLADIQKSFEENLVMNGDINAIRQAIIAASGEFTDAGPALEKYREECDTFMILTTTPLQCTLMIKEDLLENGVRPSVNLIRYRLKRAGIIFGIKEDVLNTIIQRELWETPMIVAEGVGSIKGENGTIEYKVSTEAIFTPKIAENGTADYRDIQSFTQVNEGDLLAVRVPEGKGTPGTSIFGSPLEAEPGKPYVLRPSQNVIVTADQNELRAETAGILIKKEGIISIKSDLEINGDVDFKVGNINFSGKVIINGNVLPGFTIESESDILIHGQVEASTIKSMSGSVQIEKGVIGKDSTYIYGAKQVIVNFAQDAELASDGKVTIENSLLHCKVTCEEFETTAAKATVIGGKVTAYRQISIVSAGNEEETHTELVVMDKKVAELIGKRKQLSEVLEQLNQIYVSAEREVRNKTTMIKKAGMYATDEHKASLQKATVRFETIKKKTQLVEKNIEAIDVELKREDILEGDIFISGEIHPGTHLELHKKRLSFKRPDHALHFSLKDGELNAMPIK